jgi:hypothetical protein
MEERDGERRRSGSWKDATTAAMSYKIKTENIWQSEAFVKHW